MSQLHVLIVEDEVDAAEIIESYLTHYAVSSERVPNAEVAFAALVNGQYDAAIIDIFLPGMDGVELMHTIRSHPHIAELPCIAVTAYGSSSLKHEAMQAGFNRYYPKPVNPKEIVRDLQRLSS